MTLWAEAHINAYRAKQDWIDRVPWGWKLAVAGVLLLVIWWGIFN